MRNTIEIACEHSHVEITTLVIPGENSSKEEIERMEIWLSRLANLARQHLNNVYEGNV